MKSIKRIVVKRAKTDSQVKRNVKCLVYQARTRNLVKLNSANLSIVSIILSAKSLSVGLIIKVTIM